MNEQEWKYCFAMLRSTTGESAKECYEFAEELMEIFTLEPEEDGIVAIKKRVRKVK